MRGSTIYFDGSSPKRLVCISIDPITRIVTIDDACRAFDIDPKLITKTTSQRAEYVALLCALDLIHDHEPHTLIGDCENVILQMQGVNRVNGVMRIFNSKAHELINTRGLDVSFSHVYRDNNPAGVELDRR